MNTLNKEIKWHHNDIDKLSFSDLNNICCSIFGPPNKNFPELPIFYLKWTPNEIEFKSMACNGYLDRRLKMIPAERTKELT